MVNNRDEIGHLQVARLGFRNGYDAPLERDIPATEQSAPSEMRDGRRSLRLNI